MRLYDLLPAIIRYRDIVASEGLDTPMLENLMAAFDEVLTLVQDDIEGLPDLMADFTPRSSLFLSLFLGRMVDTEEADEFREWFVKNIVYQHKIKGTVPSWEKTWLWHDEEAPRIVELYKTILQETSDYNEEETLAYSLPSARIMFSGACDTMCELGAETQELDYTEQERLIALVEDVRPIHVLLRQRVVTDTVSDLFDPAFDTLGCSSACETGEETWTGSKIISSFNDQFPSVTEDVLEVRTICRTTCETACTSCCETSCEQSYCQLKCTEGCETTCTVSCETFCQACCMLACQETCELHCTTSCEGFCEFRCENQCQAHECESGTCQGGCTTISSQLGTGPCLTGACELAACQGGSCMLLACTLSSCTITFQQNPEPFCKLNSCQGACEFACIFGCTGVACEAAACEAGVAQGLIYTNTGEFCNRCPPDNPYTTCTTHQMATTTPDWIEDMPGYGCKTLCENISRDVAVTPTQCAHLEPFVTPIS